MGCDDQSAPSGRVKRRLVRIIDWDAPAQVRPQASSSLINYLSLLAQFAPSTAGVDSVLNRIT